MAESLILVANGQQERRDAVATALVVAGLAQQVLPCDSGRRLVTEFTRALQRGAQVVAVVLEVQLPIVGGKTASIALRCVEQAFATQRAPLLFLAEDGPDANLVRVLDHLKDAHFLAVGPSAPPDAVVRRVSELLS